MLTHNLLEDACALFKQILDRIGLLLALFQHSNTLDLQIFKCITSGHITSLELLLNSLQSIDDFVLGSLVLVFLNDDVQSPFGKLHPVNLLVGIGFDKPCHDLVVAQVEFHARDLLLVATPFIFFFVLRSQGFRFFMVCVITDHPIQIGVEVF